MTIFFMVHANKVGIWHVQFHLRPHCLQVIGFALKVGDPQDMLRLLANADCFSKEIYYFHNDNIVIFGD